MSTQASTLNGAATWTADDDDAAQADPLEIFKRASILQLQFRRYGTSRRVASAAVEIPDPTGIGRDTDKRLVHVRKRILDSPELLLIEQHDGQTARWVDTKKAGPAFVNQGGFHLISTGLQTEVEQELAERIGAREPLIERFLTTLDQRIRETSKRLGPLADGIDYKRGADAAAEFGVTYAWITLGYRDPEAARRWQAEALAECRATLREAFAKIMEHMAERLTPGADGKPRIFRDTLIENFDGFVRDFSARNLADDRELENLVRLSRQVMTGIDAERLRTQDQLRVAVGKAVDQINDVAAKLVMEKPSRYYGE